MEICAYCKYECDDSTRDNCEHCGRPAKFPNVYAAKLPEEVTEIERGYLSVVSTAEASNPIFGDMLNRFESVVREQSVAIVARPLTEVSVLFDKISSALHLNFHKRLNAEGARYDGGPYDPLRVSIDSKLFPYYFKEITFAALSLESLGAGVRYGECHMTLSTSMIDYRTSLFMGNSFHAIENLKHTEPIPFGLRSTWENRGKLATIRCATKVALATTESEFSGILNDGDNDFVEAHVYGSISHKTIERVAVCKAALAGSKKTFAAALRERFAELGKSQANWSVKFEEV